MATPSTQTSDPNQLRQHAVRATLNQAPPLLPLNLFDADVALTEALEREGGAWGLDQVRAGAAIAGSVEADEHSRRAERNTPQLRTHDRYGNRIDEVDLDPSWFWLLDRLVEQGVHGAPWADGRRGAHAVRAAGMLTWGAVNFGVMCPISMTYAVVPALRDGAPGLAATWEPRLTSTDPRQVAIAGMAMTERQGGSDVRANITRAEQAGDGEWALWGHKWFCSYPPCDIFLVLAQTSDDSDAPSCFFVERGPGMEFLRLKDKLGSRSLPSSEVEFRGIRATLVGEEGRGVPAIARMVNHTRLDCLLGAAAMMRRGTLEAIHHARHRSAFGRSLVHQPAMANVLADLALESEAATLTGMRVARTYDENDAPLRRLSTAVEKYWVCKRAAAHAAEALECLGGNGYVDDSGMPQLYRDAPLGGIWEGSGNVAALDVMRVVLKEPEALTSFLEECALAAGADRRFDTHLQRVRALAEPLTAGPADPEALAAAEFGARRLTEELAVLLQASLMVRHSAPAAADAFCAARLGDDGGRAYGTLPAGVDVAAIVDRAYAA